MKHIVTLAKEASKTGEPIARYMEYEFPHQGMEKCLGQYMLGSKYLIAPITEKGQKRKAVQFPTGTAWRDIQSGEVYTGNRTFDVDVDTVLAFERLDNK